MESPAPVSDWVSSKLEISQGLPWKFGEDFLSRPGTSSKGWNGLDLKLCATSLESRKTSRMLPAVMA